MKRLRKEWIILVLQLFMFYIFPLFAGPTDTMGMVFLIILMTFVLALVMGMICKMKWKYLWPLCAAVCFLPSIYIYYNETAWIHSIWYLVISAIGLLLGIVVRKLTEMFSK